MQLFDALPGAVRRALARANLGWSCEGAAEHLAHTSIDHLCELVVQGDEQEIQRFAARYREQHGHEYAHVAARATVLR